MSRMFAVRDLDEETFRKFRAIAVEEKMKTGEALAIAMKKWIKEKEAERSKPDARNLLKIKGIIRTKEKVRWSEEVDEFLYGLEK